MAAIDYAGLTIDLYFGDKTGKTSQVLGERLRDFDNDKDEVTRLYRWHNLKLIKSFKSTIKFKVTTLGKTTSRISPGCL